MGETGLGRGASAARRSRGMLMSSCTDCEVSLLRRKTCTHVNSVRLLNLKIQKYFRYSVPSKIQISRPARILVIPYPESTGTRLSTVLSATMYCPKSLKVLQADRKFWPKSTQNCFGPNQGCSRDHIERSRVKQAFLGRILSS